MVKQVGKVRVAALGLSAALLLNACGGGKGPTPVPEGISISAPSTAETATELQFASSVLNAEGLVFSWDFGDGKTSSEARPKHSYAKGGDYEVLLQVSNQAGDRRVQSFKLSITNYANVRGLVCSAAKDGGWCWQQPTPTGNLSRDTYFTSPSTALSIGERGDLFRTTNAGLSWQRLNIGIEEHLSQLGFSDAQDGWIIGESGTLLRSADGGASWTTSKLPFTNFCCSPMSVVDARTALIPIDGNSMAVTRDGGQSWAKSPGVPTAISPKGVFWHLFVGALSKSVDFGVSRTDLPVALYDLQYEQYDQALKLEGEQTVVVSGAFRRYDVNFERTFYKQVLWRSDDAGASWTRIEPTGLEAAELGLGALRLLRVSATDPLMLGAINDKLVRSADGGLSWQRVSPQNNYALTLQQALLLDNRTVLIPSREQMARSDDVGLTWTMVSAPNLDAGDPRIRALRHVGGDLVSLKTARVSYLSTDRGKSWKPVLDTSVKRLGRSAPISFLDGRRGFMLNGQGELNETRDGGRTWTLKLQIPRAGDIDNQLQFVNEKTGWALLGGNPLYKTVDGGASWSASQSPRDYLSRFGFLDEQRGWGLSPFGDFFLLTSDGGQTWSETQPLKGVQGLHMAPAAPLVAYGLNGLLATSSDEGKSWTPRASNTASAILKVAPQDSKTLWAVGADGLVLRSPDGGSSWTRVDLGSKTYFRDVAFADARVGWIVGDAGTIYATTDGGKTWVRQASGAAQELTRVMPVDTKTAWISGAQGGLLATGNGGF